MTPCCNADRWPDIFHPGRSFLYDFIQTHNPTLDCRALLLAICLPCLALERALPVGVILWETLLTTHFENPITETALTKAVQRLIHISVRNIFLPLKLISISHIAKKNPNF